MTFHKHLINEPIYLSIYLYASFGVNCYIIIYQDIYSKITHNFFSIWQSLIRSSNVIFIKFCCISLYHFRWQLSSTSTNESIFRLQLEWTYIFISQFFMIYLNLFLLEVRMFHLYFSKIAAFLTRVFIFCIASGNQFQSNK